MVRERGEEVEGGAEVYVKEWGGGGVRVAVVQWNVACIAMAVGGLLYTK